MAFASDFRHSLTQITEINSIVGSNIFPVFSDLHVVPVITYNTDHPITRPKFSRYNGVKEASVTVDFYSRDYAQIATVTEALINQYHRFTGSMGPSNGTKVVLSTVTNTIESTDVTDNTIFRVIIEIDFLIGE